MKLSEVCFREAVRLPGTQRRELLVRARDVERLEGDVHGVGMWVGNDHVGVPSSNVAWWTTVPEEEPALEHVNAYNLNEPQVRASRKRRG